MGEQKRRTGRLGNAPIESAHAEQMNKIAAVLDTVFNPGAHGQDRKTGFVLLVYPFGEADQGRCNFISNGADRGDLVTLFKEMIARFEGQPQMQGRA